MKKIEEIKLFIDGKHVNVESGEKYNNFNWEMWAYLMSKNFENCNVHKLTFNYWWKLR